MTEFNLLIPKTEDNPITSVDQVTEDNILDPAVFDFILSIKDDRVREERIVQLQKFAKSHGQKVAFDKKLAKYSKKAKAEKRQATMNRMAQTAFFDDESDDHREYNCGQWTANQDGVHRIKFNRSGDPSEDLACPVPVYVERFFKSDQDQSEKAELKFKRGGKWQSVIVPRSTIATAHKIVQLSDRGLPVTSETAKTLVTFLADLERFNDIPIMPSTSKLGWMKDQNGDIFFTPYDNGRKIIFDTTNFDKVSNSIHTGGNYQIWLNFTKKIRGKGRIEPRIIMAASVASVLIKPLKALPFIVHLYGHTGLGKSSTFMLGASIWAKPGIPGDKEGYLYGFDATKTAFEVLPDILNNLPFFLDDTAKISKQYGGDEFIDQLIYMLSSGEGKTRSNINLGIRRVMRWQNVTITSGEHPLTDATSQGGAINRVVNIECGGTDIFEDGGEVSEITNENFGYAGKEIISYIISHLDNIQNDYNMFYDKLKDKASGKQARSAAVLLTADKVLEAAIFNDGILLDIDDLATRLRDNSYISENERCYHMIVDEINIKKNNFYRLSGEENAPRGEIWGRIINDKSSDFERVLFIPSKLEEIVTNANFSPEQFTKWAVDKDLFKHRANGRKDYMAIDPNNPKKRRYVYNMIMLDDLSDLH